MKKALVTGANGFVGSAVCRELACQGIEVIAVVRDEMSDVSRIKDLSGIRIVFCELAGYGEMPEKVADRDIDVMYHFAWEGSAGPQRADSELQIENIRHACDAVRACGELSCKRFVFAASIMEYEQEALMRTESTPGINSLYCTAKTAADQMARILAGSMGIAYIRGLISNIYGEGEKSPRLVNTSIRKLLAGEHCSFSAGEQMYDFVYITDAAKMFVGIGERGKANKTYYIGNSPRPLKEYLTQMRDVVAPEAVLGLGEVPFHGVSLSYGEFDTQGVYEDTGIRAEVSFQEGIRRTCEWIKEGN